jgi:hypothetical protein
VTWAGNLVWNVKNNTCPSGSICGQNPKLKSLNVDSFDATPQAGSPVIDKVAALSDVRADFLLQPRPSGARSDIGAYEVQAGGSAPAPAPTPPPTCSRAKPTLSLSGSTGAVAAGTTLTYNLTIRNNDSAACANTGFSLARTVPAGWSGTLSATNVTLAPGASSTATLKVTSAGTAAAGNYGIGVGTGSSAGSTHTANGSATYAVKTVEAVVAPSPTGTASTDKPSHVKGSTVYMTSRVRKDGKPVKGAARFGALKPNGVNEGVLKTTTNRNGYARVARKSDTGPSSIGTTKPTAVATGGGLKGVAAKASPVGRTATAPGETVRRKARALKDGKPARARR